MLLVGAALLLTACDLPFLDQEAKLEARREAEGKAVGSACRHSGRALEECYGLNPKISKAAIYAGWRDMDAYMRENNIQIVSPEGAESPKKDGAEAEAKPKAAEAAPAEEKPKAADAQPAQDKPKSAQAPKEVPAKPDSGPRKQATRRVA